MACTEFAMLSWGGRGPTALQVVEGKVPEVGGEVGQSHEPPRQCVPEESGAGTLWEQPVLDDLPEARERRSAPWLWPQRLGREFTVRGHLQRSVHDLVDGGEVRVPQELGLLLESQHALRVDAADGRGDLCTWEGAGFSLCPPVAPQKGCLASATPMPP